MSLNDMAKIQDFLVQQRWFAGKGNLIKKVAVVDSGELTGPTGVSLAVVQVTYELGLPEHYFLPVRLDGSGEILDAAGDPSLVSQLIDLVRRGDSIRLSAGALRGEALRPQPSELALETPGAPRVLGEEQSNTTVALGDVSVLKVLRKLEPGMNPEYEIGRFLLRQGSHDFTPPLLGALSLEGPVNATVGLLHAFAKNQGSGWRFLVDAFEASQVPSLETLGEIEKLGACVGKMHHALASDHSDPAFAPEPLLLEDLQRWSASIIGELGVTLATAASRFPSLEERRQVLLERAQRLAHLPPVGMKIRQHGDLHLGQVLRGELGWIILDFEGEPVRNVDQRREKHSPLRDLAGMMRSFAYAAAAAHLTGDARRSSLRFCRELFLRGYRAVFTDFHGDESAFNALLDAMELEKTLYEVRYELQMRPNWASIPVDALMQTDDL